MNKFTKQQRRAERALKSAMHRGVDPRNSWTVASAIFEANERRDMQREAEREAEREARERARFNDLLDRGLIG